MHAWHGNEKVSGEKEVDMKWLQYTSYHTLHTISYSSIQLIIILHYHHARSNIMQITSTHTHKSN